MKFAVCGAALASAAACHSALALGADASRPQGTAYYDPEGLAWIGGNRFVLVEERDRVVSRFTYTPGHHAGLRRLAAFEAGHHGGQCRHRRPYQ